MEPEWDAETRERVWQQYQRLVERAHEEFPTQPGRLSEMARQLQVPYAALASFICRRKKEQEMDWESSARRRVLVDEHEGDAKMAELTEEVKEQLWARYQADPGRRGLATELAAEYELDKKQVYNYLYNRKAKERSDNGRVVRVSGVMGVDLGAPGAWVSGGVPVASATITPDWGDVVRELQALRQSTIALAECVGLLIEAVRGL